MCLQAFKRVFTRRGSLVVFHCGFQNYLPRVLCVFHVALEAEVVLFLYSVWSIKCKDENYVHIYNDYELRSIFSQHTEQLACDAAGRGHAKPLSVCDAGYEQCVKSLNVL